MAMMLEDKTWISVFAGGHSVTCASGLTLDSSCGMAKSKKQEEPESEEAIMERTKEAFPACAQHAA
jgi:hypothetical protein